MMLGLLALAAILLAAYLFDGGASNGQGVPWVAARRLQIAASSAPARQAEPTRPSPAALAPSMTTIRPAPADPQANEAVVPPTQVTLELCGVGRMPISLPRDSGNEARWELLPRALGQYARTEAWARIVGTLDASPVERERAAAMVLRASGLLQAEAAPATLLQRSDTTPHVQQLATLARQTRDAGVLQWALALCEREPALEACKALTPRDLVALAPQDGRSWLLLAAADADRREEALQRAARAPAISSLPSLAAAVNSAAPASLPPYLRHELQLQALGVELALGDGLPLSFASRHCRQPANQSQSTCAAVAQALQERGPDLLAMVIGRRMGEVQGWSAARVAAAKDEETHLQAAFPDLATDQPYGCATVGRMRDWLLDRGALGERAALQRRAATAVHAASAAGER